MSHRAGRVKEARMQKAPLFEGADRLNNSSLRRERDHKLLDLRQRLKMTLKEKSNTVRIWRCFDGVQ